MLGTEKLLFQPMKFIDAYTSSGLDDLSNCDKDRPFRYYRE